MIKISIGTHGNGVNKRDPEPWLRVVLSKFTKFHIKNTEFFQGPQNPKTDEF